MKILASDHSVKNAAMWLREYLSIPPQEAIFEKFENHFRCKIVSKTDVLNKWWEAEWVEFENDKDATLFVLRWL